MRCAEFLDRHSEYLDDRLPPAEAAAWREHAGSCLRCARYDRVVRRGATLMRQLPGPELSPDFDERLRHRLYHVDAEVLAARGSHARVLLALSLAAVIAAVAWIPLARPELFERGAAPGSAVATVNVAEAPHSLFVAAASAPTPEWWQPADHLHFAATSAVHPVRISAQHLPGPYSPVIVAPPAFGSAARTLD